MPACDLCGNEYDKAFTVSMGGVTHTFDSFECAVQMMAPRCGHCACPIIGHGVEGGGKYFCCVHCAKRAGIQGLHDRVHRSGEPAGA